MSQDHIFDLNAHKDPDNEIFRYFSTDLILDAIPNGSYVLDCGAGDGAVAFPLAYKKHCRVVCLDEKTERLENIERNKNGLHISTREGNVNKLPFSDNEFDAVFSRMLLSHIPDWKHVLREKLRVCRPSGIVVFQHISLERYEFCLEHALSEEHAKEIRKGFRKGRSRASQKEVIEFCKVEGVELVQLHPLTHFLATGLVYKTHMDAGEIEEFTKTIRSHLRNPEVYKFVRWFEREVVPKLPQEFSEMIFAVIRKK